MDTGAFYALADRRDPAHSRAAHFLEGFNAVMLTTDFIFAETMSLLTKRLGKEVAVTFGHGLRTSPSIRIEEATPIMREEAWSLFSRHRDKDYDLIDCISFSMMESFGIREAFGFDRHFVQYGFRVLPD
ncbi:MAG: PIN domain-containing protein [Acidobacteriia bacterium]|nr:PIN domain-containing protein [Terriglobia bacterium]